MSQTLTGSRVAPQTMYRDEYIAGFERSGSLLRTAVTTEYMKQGNAVVFLVADSGSATAVTRGSDGLYPARVNNNNQTTLTLADATDLPRMNGFDIFRSQGPQREIMYKTSWDVISRAVDDKVIEALGTGTLTLSNTSSTDALGMFNHAVTALGNNFAGPKMVGDVTALVSPSFYQNLLKTKEFVNSKYVREVKLPDGTPTPFEMEVFQRVNIIVHYGLTNAGADNEQCYMFHKDAVAHALDKDSWEPMMGYNEEQDYSWCRATVYHAAAKLQNSGIIRMLHNGSEYGTTTVA